MQAFRKTTALKMFNVEWDSIVNSKVFSATDVAAKREMWNNFTDALCKSNVITATQYDTWTQPF